MFIAANVAIQWNDDLSIDEVLVSLVPEEQQTIPDEHICYYFDSLEDMLSEQGSADFAIVEIKEYIEA